MSFSSIAQSPLNLALNWPAWIVVALAGLATVIAIVRRPAAPGGTFVLFAVGFGFLFLAAAKPTWNRPRERVVVVSVDLSASTRTAAYRDRATLEKRIHELLRDTPYRMEFFADGRREVDPGEARLADLPCERTTYAPPAAAAVLLFSDCRFALPEQSPPTYVCVDIGLDHPQDAAVTNLEIRGDHAAVSLRNHGPARRVTLEGVAPNWPTTVPAGALVVDRAIGSASPQVIAEITPGDAWPENDVMRATVPPPTTAQRWWIGGSNAPDGWIRIDPQELPADPAAYLAPGVIAVNNVAAQDLTEMQQQRLDQYVRELGGGFLILGGDRAFAAGGYEGTALGGLSPLASNPPEPTNHWILLADGSGSMSEAVPGGTRWKYVNDAIAGALPRLPPSDVASVGSFAQTLHWWVEGKPVSQTAATPLPPAGAYPHGPTNLQPALENIAHSTGGTMPVQLLVLSDFDTQVTGVDELSNLLKSRQIHLHLLAIGEGTALPALRQVAAATGGSVVTELDPARWSAAARQLARSAAARLVRHDPVRARFIDSGLRPCDQSVDLWNRTWLKAGGTPLADARAGNESVPMAAQWNAGEGRVSAIAYSPGSTAIEALAARVARPPRDPRFHVDWQSGRTVRVVVDAADAGHYLNGRDVRLTMDGSTRAVPQTAPGRYELAFESPRSSTLATLRVEGRVLDRTAIAGRYAPEFDELGNDLPAMQALASQSGGAVIPPGQTTPIGIRWPARRVPLVSELAVAAALCFGIGLIGWRRGD